MGVGTVRKHCRVRSWENAGCGKNKGLPRPYLRNINVRWGVFDLTDLLEMRIQDEEVERYSVQKGIWLYVRVESLAVVLYGKPKTAFSFKRRCIVFAHIWSHLNICTL